MNRDVEANYQVISQQSTRRSTIRGNFGKNMILASPQAQLSLVLQLLEPNLLRFTTIPSLQKVLTARIKLEFDFDNFSSIVQKYHSTLQQFATLPADQDEKLVLLNLNMFTREARHNFCHSGVLQFCELFKLAKEGGQEGKGQGAEIEGGEKPKGGVGGGEKLGFRK